MENKKILREDFQALRFELGVARYENEDYIGALNVFKSLYDDDKDDAEVIRQIAKIYMDIDAIKYALSYWIKFLNVCDKEDRAEAYNAIGACFFLLGTLDMAGYYYELFFTYANEEDYDYLEERMDYVEAIKELDKPDFYISHPPKKAPSDKVIETAEEMMAAGNTEEALKLLRSIDKSDENYLGARLRIAANQVLNNRIGFAKRTINGLIEDFPNDPLPWINSFVLLCGTGDRKEALKVLSKLDEFNLSTYQECFKVAASCMDAELYKEAKRYAEKGLADDPYSMAGRFMAGAIEYNLGNITDAEKEFTVFYQLTGSPVGRYYIDICRNCSENTKIKRIDYGMMYPEAEIQKRIEKAIKYCKKMPKITAKNIDAILELADWVYSFRNNIQVDFASALYQTKNEKILDFIADILLSLDVLDDVKFRIISEFLLSDTKSEISVVISGVYAKFKLVPIEDLSLDGDGAIVKRAHARAFSKICGFIKVDGKKLASVAKDVYAALKENDNLIKITDVNALAVAIFVIADKKYEKELDFVSHYFATNKKAIKSTLKLIREKNVDS